VATGYMKHTDKSGTEFRWITKNTRNLDFSYETYMYVLFAYFQYDAWIDGSLKAHLVGDFSYETYMYVLFAYFQYDVSCMDSWIHVSC
jgi:hypothetical protein